MAVQEIKTMPVCVCGKRTELTVTDNGWYVVKCSSCGKTSEEQATLEDAVGAFLSRIYKNSLACFIGCLMRELDSSYSNDDITQAIEAANREDYEEVRRIAEAELDKLNSHK